MFRIGRDNAHNHCEKKTAGNENDARDGVCVFLALKRWQTYCVWYHMKCLEILDRMSQKTKKDHTYLHYEKN